MGRASARPSRHCSDGSRCREQSKGAENDTATKLLSAIQEGKSSYKGVVSAGFSSPLQCAGSVEHLRASLKLAFDMRALESELHLLAAACRWVRRNRNCVVNCGDGAVQERLECLRLIQDHLPQDYVGELDDRGLNAAHVSPWRVGY